MIKSTFLIFILLLGNLNVNAQKFSAQAKLLPIDTNGLQALFINSDIRSYAKEDLSDLRLYGSNHREVPYYLWSANRYHSSTNFEEFPILVKKITPNVKSEFIFENFPKKDIEDIELNIANSKLTKTYNISGSNDQKQWYGLLDKNYIYNVESASSTSTFVRIQLPKSNYKYYRIEINDSTSAPLEVLKIGRFKYSSFQEKLVPIVPAKLSITTNDKLKKTEIYIHYDRPQYIEHIEFNITQPNLYQRNARILVQKTRLKRHKKKEVYYEPTIEFELSSSQKNQLDIPALFEKDFIIEIDNQDNPPLELSNIQFSQLPVYMVADLKQDETYILKTGDPSLSPPNYDIAHFKINSIQDLPKDSFSKIELISNPTLVVSNQNLLFWQKKWFLWICIIIAGVAILYFSSSILKDMSKQK